MNNEYNVGIGQAWEYPPEVESFLPDLSPFTKEEGGEPCHI